MYVYVFGLGQKKKTVPIPSVYIIFKKYMRKESQGKGNKIRAMVTYS